MMRFLKAFACAVAILAAMWMVMPARSAGYHLTYSKSEHMICVMEKYRFGFDKNAFCSVDPNEAITVFIHLAAKDNPVPAKQD